MQFDGMLTIDNLKAYQLPLTCSEGISYLEELRQSIIFLPLYQDLFPKAWQNSTTPLLQRFNSCEYSEREIEFLELVDKHLFPLDWLEDAKIDLEKHFEIPVYSHELEWWNADFDDLEFIDRFILSFLENGYLQEEWGKYFGFIPNNLVSASITNYRKLKKLSECKKKPLSFFYDVISIVNHSTDCIWIDITSEDFVSLPWTKDSLLYLSQQWQVAQEYYQKKQQLEEWLQSSINHRIQAVKLWNAACK